MNFKKVIVLLIVLMFLTPSFAFAAESDSAGSESGNAASSQSNFENSERRNSDTFENSDSSLNASEFEQLDESEIFDNPSEWGDNLDLDDSMTSSTTSTGIPGIDIPSLTAIQSPDLNFANDAYLTSLFSGAAVYTYPIQVPAGINGFQPRVELIYNSQSVGGQYGWLGDGWSLNEFYILRDVNFTPNDISDDRFKLIFGGQSHNLIYNAESGFYHTEIETYLRVQRLAGGTNQKGEYWIVTTKDGIEYRFGFTEDSELMNSVVGRDYVSKWKLDQVKDLNGNLIVYNYVKNPIAGEVGTSYLSSIVYNNGLNTIEFVRTGKVNEFSGYFNGNFVVEKSLLSSIRIREQNSVIYTYDLSYRNSRGHQTLGSIRVVGTDGNIQNNITTSFSYFDAPNPGSSNFARQSRTLSQNTYPSIYVSATNPTLRYQPIDLNGDGLTDLMRSYQSGTNVIYENWINNGNGFTLQTGTVNQNDYPAIHVGVSNFTPRFMQIDLNGDGRMDLMRSYQSGTNVIYEIWINNGDGFTRQTGTVSQNNYPAVHVSNTDFTTRFLQIDLNGNGLTDLVRSYPSGNNVIYEIWINNGDGFTRQTGTVSQNDYPAIHVSNTNFTLRYHPTDLNGDGLTDLMRSYQSGTNVIFENWINNGDGFTRQTGTVSQNTYPAIHMSATNFTMRYLQTDLNGDKLPDFIHSYQSGNDVIFENWINTGNGFTRQTGTVARTSYLPLFMGVSNFTSQYLQIDLNGDGIPDFMQSYQSGTNVISENWVNSISTATGTNFRPPNLLNQIIYPSGGITSIEYETSTKFDNTKENGSQELPTPITVVRRVQIDSGTSSFSFPPASGNSHRSISTYTYNYTGGFMHVEPRGKTEFRGFRQVTVNDGRSAAEHYFHQDQAKKGNEYKTIIRSNAGVTYSITEYEYTVAETNGVFEILLTNSTNSLYDGQATPIISKTSYEYDLYGNPTKIHSFGDVSITSDEKTVLFEYTYNINDWILNRVKKETLLGHYGQRVAETKFYYDGNSNLNAAPTRGLMTKTVVWNSHGDDIVHDFEYDSYGNLIAHFDGNGHLTTVEYSENPVNPISFTNAMGQTTFLEYDTRIGKLTKITDPNGFETSMEYDSFGRITKIIQPGDSSESPTIWYHYYNSRNGLSPRPSQEFLPISGNSFLTGSGPMNFIMIRVKEVDNQYYDTWKFYDGLGRVIRTFSESVDVSENIIQEISYNNFGDIQIIVAPRKSFEPRLNTTKSYDSFGRLIRIANPDGTSQRIEYEQLKTTFFDERGNKIQMDKDIYGNIIKVTEFNHGEIYETRYEYDAANNLIRILPNQYYDQSMISFLMPNENEVIRGIENTTWFEMALDSLVTDTSYKVENISFTYDSLGRLVRLDDPNLGTWRFEYNANGKLASQTDSRGITIYYDYDALDRIILIDYPNDDNVIFEYDIGTIGTLSSVITGILTKSYLYDERLRVIQEKVSIEGYENSFGSTSVVEPFEIVIQSKTNLSSESFPENILESSELQTFDRFSNIFESDYGMINTLEDLSIYNQANFRENVFEIQSSSMSVIREPEFVSLSSHSGTHSETVIEGSFVNQEDITLQLGINGQRVQQLDLTGLRVSMSPGDWAFIYLNDREALRFINSLGSSSTLQVFDERGNQLGLISRTNGKPTSESVTFDISFIHDGSVMFIEIQRYDHGIPNGTFSYSYMTINEISALRAYMIGYQSGVDYITGNYEVVYVPFAPPEIILTFENEESYRIHNNGLVIRELVLTDFRASMGLHDSASIFLNNYEVMRFTDSPAGGTLRILDEAGNELDSIHGVNGNPLYENMAFNIKFDRVGSSLAIDIEKMKDGSVIDERSYVVNYEVPIMNSWIYISGYQSGVNYISGQHSLPFGSTDLTVNDSFLNNFDSTIPLAIGALTATELHLTNFRPSWTSILFVHMNDRMIMRSDAQTMLRVFDENGVHRIPIQLANGHSNIHNAAYDISFIKTDSGVFMEIEHFVHGAYRDTYRHTYNFSELEEIRIQVLRDLNNPLFNYIRGEYEVKYELSGTNMIPNNMFQNEGDITIDFFRNEKLYPSKLNLTNFRAVPTENSNISIYLNDLEMFRFSENNSGTISIFDSNHSLVDTLQNINSNTSYQNVSFNVLLTADMNELNVLLEKMEVDELVDTFSYSLEFNESITNMGIVAENYQSGISFVDGEISSTFSVRENPYDSIEFGPDFITTYQYDSMDRIIQKTLPNGRVVDYVYNNQSLLESIPWVIDNIDYNSMNLITRTEFTNGVTTDLTYDSWTKRIQNINTLGLQNLDYSFDEKGNIIGISDHLLNEHQYFFYDDLDRLLLAGSENYVQVFAFNPLGSILAHGTWNEKTGDSYIIGFEFGNGAGIHAPTRVGDMHLFYDANGNLIEDETFIYVYNDANRLVEVLKKADDNRVIAEFVYDETGRRIKKIENGVVSYYINQYFDVVDGEATVYYFANGQRVARESAEGRFWYLNDHLGSASVMVDVSGELVERILYYPFGAHRSGGEEKYTFTGKELDTGIGLYYFEARYYNPLMFVFTQPDSIIPDVYNPQALNRYAYCYNNPLKYVDPDGHTPKLAVAAPVVAKAVVISVVKTAVIHGAWGALAGGGIEAGKQIQASGGLSGGGQVTDWSAVRREAGYGFVAGAVTGGMSKVRLYHSAGTKIAGQQTISLAERAGGAAVQSIVGVGSGLTGGVVSDTLRTMANGGSLSDVLEEERLLAYIIGGSFAPAGPFTSAFVSNLFLSSSNSVSGNTVSSGNAVISGGTVHQPSAGALQTLSVNPHGTITPCGQGVRFRSGVTIWG